MATTIKKGPFKIQLLHFMESVGAELDIVTYPVNKSATKKKRVTVHFKKCEVVQGHLLCGKYGDATTLNGALKDYAQQISGQLLRFDGYGSGRRDVKAPAKLFHNNSKL